MNSELAHPESPAFALPSLIEGTTRAWRIMTDGSARILSTSERSMSYWLSLILRTPLSTEARSSASGLLGSTGGVGAPVGGGGGGAVAAT